MNHGYVIFFSMINFLSSSLLFIITVIITSLLGGILGCWVEEAMMTLMEKEFTHEKMEESMNEI